MKIELLHPVSHGTGRGKTTTYGRGIQDLPDAFAKELLAIGKHHPDCPANAGGDCFQETVEPAPGELRAPTYMPVHKCDVIARLPVTKSAPQGKIIEASVVAKSKAETTEKKK
jgi:hypothetical protein